MTIAVGREMTYRDNAEIERIVNLKPTDKYGFRDLVEEIVASETFAKR
jgi:hypothetical protein